MLRAAQLKPGATIVEYGIGWGHTTLALAQLGYNVIAVDIEEKFLKLVEHRANHLGLKITTHHGEFGELPSHIEQRLGVTIANANSHGSNALVLHHSDHEAKGFIDGGIIGK